MSVVEQEKSEVAALNAKLSGARSEIRAKDKELNDLRNRVVRLEDKSITEELEGENKALAADLKETAVVLADVKKQLAKAQSDFAAAAPALALVEALNAVKA